MPDVNAVIEALGLQPHPCEGGWFAETYRSRETVPQSALGADRAGSRAMATAIYYLLTPETFSEMHRLPGDEIFHFYLGDPVTQLWLPPDGSTRTVTLGSDVLSGQQPQVVVPGGVWQGAFLNEGGAFALLGTTMSPGFDYADYETGARAELLAGWPDAHELITRLTR